MKVLIFTTYFLPIVGGVQTSVVLLAKGLAEMDAQEAGGSRTDVTVATATPAGEMNDNEFPFRVVRQPGLFQLRKLIRESDVIHVAGPSLLPMALAWLFSKPFCIEHAVYQAICPNGLLFLRPEKAPCPGYFLERKYDRCAKCRAAEVGMLPGLRSILLGFPRLWLCRRAAGNIAITNHVKERVRLPRTRTMYYGIEPLDAPILAAASIESRANGNKTLEVSFVGRLVAEKGIPVLLSAAQKLQLDGVNFHLSLFGDGPEGASLRNLARELQIERSVTFRGELRGEGLRSALREVSTVVMPSIWEETAGLSAIEHMMRGGVVIAADVGGLSEIVGDAGLKFPMGDASALASCIQRLTREPSLAASLGAAARARARRLFNVKSMIDEHLALYRESLKPCATNLRQGTPADAS